MLEVCWGRHGGGVRGTASSFPSLPPQLCRQQAGKQAGRQAGRQRLKHKHGQQAVPQGFPSGLSHLKGPMGMPKPATTLSMR
jgi:hypothetical protein